MIIYPREAIVPLSQVNYSIITIDMHTCCSKLEANLQKINIAGCDHFSPFSFFVCYSTFYVRLKGFYNTLIISL